MCVRVCVGRKVGGVVCRPFSSGAFQQTRFSVEEGGGGVSRGGGGGASQRAEGSGLGGWPPVLMISPDSSVVFSFFLQRWGCPV